MQRKHALTFVTITVFLDTIGFGIIVPIMPEYLTQLAGIDLSAASAISGYLMVSFAVTNFLFAPLLGSLSDRYGRRPVLMLSLFFYGVSYLIAGFATALWVLFIGRFLTGVTSATYATANALIADVSPPEQRAQNFGLLGLAFGLGFIFGPTIGGILGAWDLRAPFFVAAALTFINTAYGFFFLKETLSANNRRAFELRRANPIGALRQVKRYPILLGLIIGMFIFNIGHHVYPANWNFYAIEKFRWTPIEVGLSMGFVGLLAAIVQGGLIRVVIPKFGTVRCAAFGLFCAATAYLGIAFAASAMSVYLWFLVSAFAGLSGPAITSIMSNQLPQNEQGELQGIMASAMSLASIIGPLLMTQTFAFFTSEDAPVYLPGSAFLVAALLTVVALAIFLQQVPKLPNADLNDSEAKSEIP
ncbi:MAG: tetracycline resistance MFS efflux pump [Gammaproteobacteria bacterium]|nr:tetracycline resistance MFS efflux pump [Gammaproteobacteria bacterium]MAD07734.1 tetracycline resistance MFS efflux pump [Gammaproteobacteria bacterium]